MYGKVEAPYWDERPVAIVAGGLSLAGFDFTRLRDTAHVLAVKGSIFDLPWADAGFGIDVPRLREWMPRMRDVRMPVFWAVPPDKRRELEALDEENRVTFLERLPGEGVSKDPSKIYSGGTSGFGALQLALLKRARSVYLFGYDYTSPAMIVPQHPRRRSTRAFRHNDEHYGQNRQQNPRAWRNWASYYNHFFPVMGRVKIVNASPLSAITAFPKVTLAEALRQIEQELHECPQLSTSLA